MTSRTPHRTARSSGFFDWIREAATVRSPKWLGGVAGGIATRVGIDPIIMRGIFVVLTLLGFPAILLYGILWLVLPDEDGTIQLQELRHGRLHPVQLAIALTLVLSLVPVGGVLWFGWAFVLGIVNSNYYYNIVDSIMWSPFSPSASGFVEWFVIVVVVIIVSAILIAVLRGGISSQPAAPHAGATVAHTAAEVPVAAEPAVVVPRASDVPADTRELKTHVAESDEAYREWREQQAKAHEEHENFRVDQLDDRAATARLKAEQREERTRFAQQAARQRAARRAANPRASVAYTVGVIGLAGVTASVVALVRAHAGAVEAIGLAALTGALILAAGMIVAGLLRRRSGFLAFTTVAALLIGGGSLAQARTNDLVWPGGSVYVGQLDSVNQPFGYLSIWTMNQPRLSLQPMRVVKGEGQTDIYVSAGTSLTLNVSIASNERWDTVNVEAVDGDNSWIGLGEPVARELVGGGKNYSITIDNPGQGMVTTPVAVDLTQASGSVRVTIDRDWGGVNPTIGTFTDLNAEAKK